ncbi:MAG: NERD domain-containing protein [Eubacteriaceae bacterium]|nr:NERD domain-containing protein [Eubacteriaceae bacterium]
MLYLYTYQTLIVALICIVPIPFALGFALGFFVKNVYRYRLRTNQNQGEASVYNIIKNNFLSPQYHLMNNLTIPFEDGTTQIDHVLVSTKGIFVIETKNYSGWIFANEKSKQWTQVRYRVKNRFQNPIHQNYLHIKAIEELFDFLPKEHIHSAIVFSGDGEFKTPIPNGFYYLKNLTEFLNTFQDDIISPNRVQFCVGRLECTRYEITKKTDVQHQAYLDLKFGKHNG